MRNWVTRLIAVTWVSAMVAAAFGQNTSESETRTKLLALQHAWSQAKQFNDLKALDSLLDTDLIYIHFDGDLMDKAHFLARMESTLVDKEISESMTVQVFDDTAIVNGTYRSNEMKNGKVVPRTLRFTNTWMQKGSNWVCIAAQTTPILHQKAP